MVPAMQRALLGAVLCAQPSVRSLLDPFVGSGTVVSEAMYAGLDVRGLDVNPLAVLVCRAKAGPFRPRRLRAAVRQALRAARADGGTEPEADFPNVGKWFTARAVRELSRLRRAIRAEGELWARRFLWVALAETVRRTSCSRTSTYKLHIRPSAEVAGLPSPLAVFDAVVGRNLARHAAFAGALRAAGLLDGAGYRGRVACDLADAREPIEGTFDVVVTSPPYGDNTSTVPYGQSSYLPLQWIDAADIDPGMDGSYLRTTHEIDARSLGGARPRGDVASLSEDLRRRSSALDATLAGLGAAPRDRAARVYFFVRDLDASLGQIARALRPNGYMLWTIGNRRVGGVQVPLGQIVADLLDAHGVARVLTLDRRIPSKRMATRNSFAATMRAEEVIVFRKVRVGCPDAPCAPAPG
jgi:SAM-dependent methyltransferase